MLKPKKPKVSRVLLSFLKTMMSEKLTPKEISKLIKSSGFKSKAEFARKMGLNVVTVNSWGLKNPAPVYLTQVLEWAKKARLYDKLMKEG